MKSKDFNDVGESLLKGVCITQYYFFHVQYQCSNTLKENKKDLHILPFVVLLKKKVFFSSFSFSTKKDSNQRVRNDCYGDTFIFIAIKLRFLIH